MVVIFKIIFLKKVTALWIDGNGGTLNGKYVYFATDEFPFFPRCHWGNVSKDFIQKGG